MLPIRSSLHLASAHRDFPRERNPEEGGNEEEESEFLCGHHHLSPGCMHELVSAVGVFLFRMGRCMLNLSAAGNNLLPPPHLISFSRFLFPFPASPCAEREKPCKSFPPPPPLFFAGDGEFALFPCPLFCHLSAVEGRESETDFPHNGEKNRKWERREKEKPQLNRRRKGGREAAAQHLMALFFLPFLFSPLCAERLCVCFNRHSIKLLFKKWGR